MGPAWAIWMVWEWECVKWVSGGREGRKGSEGEREVGREGEGDTLVSRELNGMLTA